MMNARVTLLAVPILFPGSAREHTKPRLRLGACSHSSKPSAAPARPSLALRRSQAGAWERVACLLTTLILVVTAPALYAQNPFAFRDAGDEAGLFPHVARIAGHGVGWGDVDGDGWP